MSNQIKRIAMWASPRCRSTILLRSWASRPDTFVHDEPLYPHYLLVSGREDPGRDEVLSHYETDWVKIAEQVTAGTIPDGKLIYYQKYMVYRLLPYIDLDWVVKLTNCFLIRKPEEMLSSYLKLWSDPPTLETIGILRLKKLFDTVSQHSGTVPPVIDSQDLVENPRRILSLLCEAVEVEFTDAMLEWPIGNPTNDTWSKYGWYDTARNSTRFLSYKSKTAPIPARFQNLLAQCNEVYNELYKHRLV